MPIVRHFCPFWRFRVVKEPTRSVTATAGDAKRAPRFRVSRSADAPIITRRFFCQAGQNLNQTPTACGRVPATTSRKGSRIRFCGSEPREPRKPRENGGSGTSGEPCANDARTMQTEKMAAHLRENGGVAAWEA